VKQKSYLKSQQKTSRKGQNVSITLISVTKRPLDFRQCVQKQHNSWKNTSPNSRSSWEPRSYWENRLL